MPLVNLNISFILISWNLHGTGHDASKQSKFARQRQSDLVYANRLSDKNFHDESETAPVDKFDFPSQIGGIYDDGAPLNSLPSESGEDDDF